MNEGQRKQKDGQEGEFGGKKREKMDHRLSEHGVRWPRRIKFTISFTTNKSSSHNLKMKEKKKFSLRDTDLALPATATLGKPALCFSSRQALPLTLTIRHPAIGSCISRSRHPWGRAACLCGLWPVSVSAPPSGLATPSARPGHGHSDTPLLRGRPCSSGTCRHK